MSEFSCPIVRLSGISKHPNADSLSLVTVEGCPVVIRTEDYKEGDLAVYVPIDAIVPESVPGTEFLGTHRRIRAARLRKIFSMGLLLPASIVPLNTAPKSMGFGVGDDVADYLGIKKYDPGEPEVAGAKKPKTGGKQAVDPKLGPVYDLESYRKYGKHVFKDGDSVVVTEKIHGTNFRFGHRTETKGFKAFLRRLFHRPAKTVFCVGSHKTWRQKDDSSVYWKIAKAFNLEESTREFPDLCFYGEIYGSGIHDLVYVCGDGELKLALFDVFDSVEKKWADHEGLEYLAENVGVPLVPVVYRGPFAAETVESMRNGQSTLANQIREGVVIRHEDAMDGRHPYRGVLKLVGDDYLLRGGKTTEFH